MAKKAAKSKAQGPKKPAHTFRNAADAEAWASTMEAQIKAGQRPNNADTLGQIENARAIAKDLRAKAG